MPCLFLPKQSFSEQTCWEAETSTMQNAFDEICISLETDSELFTLDELRYKMVKAYGADAYMVERMKQKL